MHFKNFTDIPVWKKAHSLVLSIYKFTNNFPKHEIYGLTSQIRRAIVSVAANIVEGVNRKTDKEKVQFLFQAKGSITEVQYFLILAKDLLYIDQKQFDLHMDQAIEIAEQIGGWIKYLKKENNL